MDAKDLTTIIVPAYVQTELSAHITMACIHNIIKYTNLDEYELILIHDQPKHKVRDDFGIFKKVNYREIILSDRTNYSTKMNLGFKEGKGKYFAFIQNDCFVWDNWLTDARYYLENGLGECIIPHQWPVTRDFVLENQKASYEESLNKGARDACAIVITREAFEKTGGFNDDIEAFVEADFYERIAAMGVNQITSGKFLVTHLSLATHYQDMDGFNAKMHHDSLIRNK